MIHKTMSDFYEVVNDWYDRLREPFINYIASRFSNLDTGDIEDIYNDTFMSVFDNLKQGTVAPDTNWKSYIFRIGYNQVLTHTKAQAKMLHPTDQDDGDEDDNGSVRQWEKIASLNDMLDEFQLDPADKEKMVTAMNSIMMAMPEPCRTILPDFYYNGMSLDEIKDEIGYSTTDAVKTQRYKCFQRLQKAVRSSLEFMGLSIFED